MTIITFQSTCTSTDAKLRIIADLAGIPQLAGGFP